MIRLLTAAAACLALASPAMAQTGAQQGHHQKYDYPTSARADYVIGCLAGSNFDRQFLDKCSCGIDTIADLMPYEDYEQADTILRMQQGGLGDRGAMFRDTPVAKERTEELRRAQAEVSLRCQ